MDLLHEYGFSVAIDDFWCSGFSSLNMPKDLISILLKVDSKFLEGLWNAAARLESGYNRQATYKKWLGIPVVAEGVETKAQVDFLFALGAR